MFPLHRVKEMKTKMNTEVEENIPLHPVIRNGHEVGFFRKLSELLPVIVPIYGGWGSK